MLTTTTAFDNTVKNTSITAKTKVLVERSWTHLSNEAVAREFHTQNPGLDEGKFPIESIIKLAPPTTGIPFAITDFGIQDNIEDTDVLYRVSSEDNAERYTYWISDKSDSDGNLTNIEPGVQWDVPQPTNKLIAHFDITYCTPTSIDVYTRDVSDGAWTLRASSQTVDSDGVLELYLQDGGTWSTTYNINNSDDLAGVKFDVNTLNIEGHAHVIATDGRYVTDVTDDVINWSVSKSREEQDAYTPRGIVHTNVLSLTLDDVALDTLLIDRNTKVTVEVGYDTTAAGGSAEDLVPAGVFYIDSFTTDHGGATVSIQASDFTRFLQETFAVPRLLQNISLRAAVNELLRSAGFNNISFRFTDADNIDRSNRFPYLWWNDDETIWDIMVELVKAEQGAFYANESGDIEIVDYGHLGLETSSSFTFDDSDIIDINEQYRIEANDITINHYKYAESYSDINITSIGADSDGNIVAQTSERVPITQILWSPSEEVVLGSAVLYNDIDVPTNEPPIRITWNTRDQIPLDKGEVNIEGEYFTYDGKTESDGAYVELNTTARALRGSVRREHRQDTSGWTKERIYPAGKAGSYTNESQTFSDGKMRMQLTENGTGTAFANFMKAWHTTDTVVRGSKTLFGTKFSVRSHEPGVEVHNMAGLYLNKSDNTGTYYFELVGWEYVEASDYAVGTLRMYKADGNGANRNGLPNTPDGLRGFFFPIVEDMTIQLEVVFDGTDTFDVYANGIFVTSFTDSTYNVDGRFGVYVRGNTLAEFEYLYAASLTTDPEIENYRARDSVTGGYLSRWPYQNVDKLAYFTEFQPDVREVRTFEVDYSIYPALNGLLFNVNDLESNVVSEQYGAFDAKVVIENISHESAVLNGIDADILPGFDIETKLAIYGRAVIVESENKKRIKDTGSIRRRGLHSVEIESPWIQSADRAEAIATYIRDQWKAPVRFITMDCVPNPALQPGDIVTVSWAERGFSEDFYISEMGMNFDGGLQGNLLLRSV